MLVIRVSRLRQAVNGGATAAGGGDVVPVAEEEVLLRRHVFPDLDLGAGLHELFGSRE